MLDGWKAEVRRIIAGLTSDDLERLGVEIETARDDETSRRIDDATAARHADVLARAAKHRDELEIEAAWTTVKAARREAFRLAPPVDLMAEADAVCREAAEKLTGWRSESVQDLLSSTVMHPDDLVARLGRVERILELPAIAHPADEPSLLLQRIERAAHEVGLPTAPADDLVAAVTQIEDKLGWPVSTSERRDDTVARVVKAKEILDEHADNVYRKFRLLRKNVLRVSAWLAVLLVALVVVVSAEWVPDTMAGDDSPLASWELLVAVMALGALGGILSGAIEIGRGDRKLKIPQLRTYYTLIWMRPVIGAAGAVVVITILQSGLGEAVTLESSGVVAVAIVAGFTERFVTKTVSSAADAVSK